MRIRSQLGRLGENRFWPGVLGVAFLCALVSLRASRGGGFHDDDLVNLGYSQDTGFGLDSWLGPPRFREHLVPAAALLHKLMAAVGPEWWLARVTGALFVALLVVGVALAVRQITESEVAGIFVSALVGTSGVVLLAANWWTSTTLHLPMLCAASFTVFFALKWSVTGSRLWFGLAVAAQVVSCSFSDRAMLIPLLVGMLLFVNRPRGGRSGLERSWRDLRAAFPLFAALMAVVFVQLALTLLFAKTETTPALTVALSTTASMWRNVVMYWWGIGVSSVAINSFAKAAPVFGSTGVSFAGAIGLLVLAVTAAMTIRSPRAAFVWIALVFLVTLSGVQIAFGKLANASPQLLGAVPRYQDLTVLFLATLIPASWAVSSRPWPSRRSTGLALVACLAVLFGVWLLNLRVDVQVARPPLLAAGAYASNLRTSLARWDSSGKEVTLLDERIPNEIVLAVPATQGYNLAARVARVIASDGTVPPVNSISGEPLRVDAGGSLRAVRLGAKRKLTWRGSGCGRAAAGARWATLGVFSVKAHIPPSVSSSGLPVLLEVALSRSGSAGSIGVVQAGGWPLYLGLPLDEFGRGFRLVVPNQIVDIEVQLWDGAQACITSIDAAPIVSP